MQKPIRQGSRHSGFLYIMRRADIPDHIKIGHVKAQSSFSLENIVDSKKEEHPVYRRCTKLSQKCKAACTVISEAYIPCKAVQRMERLVYLTLQDYRIEIECSGCEVQHNEWFNVEAVTATKWIETVAIFARQVPYNEGGELVKPWSSSVDYALAYEKQSNMKKKKGRKRKGSNAPVITGGSGTASIRVTVMSWLETNVPQLIGSKDSDLLDGKPQLRRSVTM